MNAAIDITAEQRKTLLALLRRFIPGVAVWAYGSRVKWTARPNSDLDLVAFTTPAQRHLVSALKEALDESDLPFLVDLHVWDEVPEKFREIIRKEYVVLQEAGRSKGSLGVGGDSPIKYDLRWPVVSLAEIATKIGSGATPKGGADAYLPSRARFALVRSQNVFDRRFDHDGLAFITDEQADGLRGVALQPNDILLNITGDGITFGRACMVPKDVLPACVNQHVSIVRLNPLRADAGYVLAYLTHPEVKSYIESFNAGGSRRAVTKGHIESFRLPLPPLPEQRAIAHILGTLDDKIELNRRMNETLEAMARALFKSWFVDFDPVRAKAEGRDPGLPQPLADLFPDSFEDSELGEIPKGWAIGRFGDVVEQLRDQENPLASPDALFHHFSIPAFDTGQSPKPEYGESIKSLKSRVPVGVVLLSKLNPEIDRVWMVDVRLGERAVCSTEFLVLRALPPFTRSYIYCLARSPLFRQQIEGLVTGTSKSHQRAQVESILNLAVVVPPSPMVEAFDHCAEGLLVRTHECRRESHSLATLRDTLLPKLISGELRVASGLGEAVPKFRQQLPTRPRAS